MTPLSHFLGSRNQVPTSISLLPYTKPEPFRKQPPDNPHSCTEPARTVPSRPPSGCACPSHPTARRFSVHPARVVGGGWGGARVGMKEPFSSTAGRAAATKARLDTVCPGPLCSWPPLRVPCASSLRFPFPHAWLHQGPGQR